MAGPGVGEGRRSVSDLPSGSVRISVWRYDHDTLAFVSASQGHAGDKASFIKTDLSPEARQRGRTLATSGTLALQLSSALEMVRRANPNARVTFQSPQRQRIAYDAARDRAIYATGGTPHKGSRVVSTVGEERGTAVYRQVIRQVQANKEWRTASTTLEMYDSAGAPTVVMVSEYSLDHSLATAAIAGPGVRDALAAVVDFVLPAKLHAATIDEDPCFAERWDLWEATAYMEWKFALALAKSIECIEVPSPSCLWDLPQAWADFDQSTYDVEDKQTALFNCLNRMTNMYGGGGWQGDKWCELWIILVTTDGGLTWTGVGSFEICYGGYEM